MHLSYFLEDPACSAAALPTPAASTTRCFGTKLFTKGAELTLLSDERITKAITKGTAEDGQPGLEEGQWICSGQAAVQG